MSSQAVPAHTRVETIGVRLRRAGELLSSIRPAYLLGALLVVQWLALLAFAVTVKHNGWLYYAGGDQLGITRGILSAHELPPARSATWSMMLLPISWFASKPRRGVAPLWC